MPISDVSLNLDNFIKHVNHAADSDSLVMRDDGKISERGRIRTAFTSTERCRETTRQFIDKYCQNAELKTLAETFFRDNLNGENAKPLKARTVRNFLSMVNAREHEKAERAERFAAFQADLEAPRLEENNPQETGNANRAAKKPKETQKEVYEHVKSAFSKMYFTRAIEATPAGEEVMKELQMALSKTSKWKSTRDSLYAFAQDILNDSRLSEEQCVRRLNLLTNFIDRENPTSGCKLDYENPVERQVFQRLLEATNAPGVDWNTSSDRILARAMYPNMSISRTEEKVHDKVDFVARVRTLSVSVQETLQESIIQKMVLLVPMKGMSKKEQVEIWKKCFADPFAQKSVMYPAIAQASHKYRTTDIGTYIEHISTSALAYLPKFIGGIKNPQFDGPSVATALCDVARMQRYPDVFRHTLGMKNSMNPTEKVTNGVAMATDPSTVSDPNAAYEKGKLLFVKDFDRSHSAQGMNRWLDRRTLAQKTCNYVLFDQANQKAYVENPSQYISLRAQTQLAKDHLSPNDLTKEQMDMYWERGKFETTKKDDGTTSKNNLVDDQCKKFYEKIHQTGGQHGKQTGSVLTFLTQNQDIYRDQFEFLGGKMYNRGVFANNDGSMTVVFASPKDSPVHQCKVIYVDKEGNCSFDENENYITNDPSKVTQKLRDLQNLFENVCDKFEQETVTIEKASLASGHEMTLEESNAAARDKMYANGIDFTWLSNKENEE